MDCIVDVTLALAPSSDVGDAPNLGDLLNVPDRLGVKYVFKHLRRGPARVVLTFNRVSISRSVAMLRAYETVSRYPELMQNKAKKVYRRYGGAMRYAGQRRTCGGASERHCLG